MFKDLEGLDDESTEMELMRLLAACYVEAKAYDEAQQVTEDIIRRSDGLKDYKEKAAALYTSSLVKAASDDADEAFKAAEGALEQYKRAGDKRGEASCLILKCDHYILMESTDDCMDAAKRALALYQEEGDVKGMANAMQKHAVALKLDGQLSASLDVAMRAGNLFVSQGDRKAEVDTLITQAEAKIELCDGRNTNGKWVASIVSAATVAANAAKEWRIQDNSVYGTAQYSLARVLLWTKSAKSAYLAAKEAMRAFRKAGNTSKQGHAVYMMAHAEYKMGEPQNAKSTLGEALSLFEKAGDQEGRMKATHLLDDVYRALGIPTQAELEAQRLQQQQYQMQMMMMQQQQMGGAPQGGGGGPQVPIWMQNQGGGGDMGDAPQSGGAIQLGARDALDVKGADASGIKNKVMEVATAIIGEGEDIEADMPLMEAGLTSNTAVILRDELSKDIPGVNLPPTLIFDYPSVAAITDFIVERSKR